VSQFVQGQMSCCLRVMLLSAMLAGGAAPAVAQHTVVENNGTGGRIETDYNAAEKITQMRTFGPDGNLQQKVEYEYLPGHYVAQQTSTSYWPNAKVRRRARNTYDESANFTGEFIELFDQTGKQIAGHKLSHDPWTGEYRCSEWSLATQGYRSVECPAGEEESGGAEEVKRFTYDEVMRNLEVARKAARRDQKIGRMQPATAVHPPIRAVTQEVGLVFPAQLRPGERVSGTVVEDPELYNEMPEVTVTRVAIPFESAGEASRLSGWLFEAPGEKPQRADGPITLVVPRHDSGLEITFRQAGNSAHSVSKTLTFPQPAAEKPLAQKSFRAAALCLKGALCTVSGPFSGDSSKTFAAFEDRPARIVAETTDSVYISIPELTASGARPLFIAEGSKIVGIPEVVGEFVIRNNHRELSEGQTLLMFPTLDGPAQIPDVEWRPGNFPATNLAQARQLIPGFQLPEEDHEAQVERENEMKKGEGDERRESNEKREERKAGLILVVVKNVTPEHISLRSSKNEMLVFSLSDRAFHRGEFKYDLLAEAKKAGRVEVKGYVIPFLAAIAGQEFSVKAAAR
jgi:hypothetical protein